MENTDAGPFHGTEPNTQNTSRTASADNSAYKHVVPKLECLPSDSYYKVNHKYRGNAYIFNHEFFTINNLERRIGTNKDCRNLKKVLKKLKFKMKIFKDLTFNELKREITKASSKDYSKHDCVLVIILTHGENNQLYAKDQIYKTSLIWESFVKNHTLEKKPKLFFVQACQGTQQDEGIQLTKDKHVETTHSHSPDSGPFSNNEEFESKQATYEFFSVANFLIVYSTVPNHVSWRSKTFGAYFIQALVEKLEFHGKEVNLLTILTLVNQKMSIDFETSINKRKQVIRIHSTLTRLLVFKDNCSIL